MTDTPEPTMIVIERAALDLLQYAVLAGLPMPGHRPHGEITDHEGRPILTIWFPTPEDVQAWAEHCDAACVAMHGDTRGVKFEAVTTGINLTGYWFAGDDDPIPDWATPDEEVDVL